MASTYDQQYKAANYDSILVRVRKGKREEYKQVADNCGLGLMELFRRGVEEFIANHGGEIPAPRVDAITSEQRKILDALGELPPAVRKSIVKLISELAAEQRRSRDRN